MALKTRLSLTKTFNRDKNDPRIWDVENSTLVNIQLLNSLDFGRITGYRAPPTPITRDKYRDRKIPWFDLYDDHLNAADTKAGKEAFRNLKTLEATRPYGARTNEMVITLPVSATGRHAPSFGTNFKAS